MSNTSPIWEGTYLPTYLFISFFLSFIIITLYTLGCCKQIYKSTTIVTTTIYFTNVCACKWFGRKNEGIDRVRKACVKIKDPWHFSKWEQAHYNTVADGELVDLNWYPPCENKWVSEWVDGVGSQLMLTASKQMSEKIDGSQPIPSKWKQNERVIYIEATIERPTRTHLHKMYKGWTENPHTVQ